jgi:hypothetical protein
MSLSFVKSAVLSSTDGVSHNEETTIDNRETKSIRASSSSTYNKPLFDQLRANKEAQQLKDDEYQRSLRGMATLNDEDCAHLNTITMQQLEMENAVQSRIEQEVALFRAAKEDRGLAQTVLPLEEEQDNNDDYDDDEEDMNRDDGDSKNIPVTNYVAKIVPKFTIKKKRKRVVAEEDNASIVAATAADSQDYGAATKATTSGTTAKEMKQTKVYAAASAAEDDDDVHGEMRETKKKLPSSEEEKKKSNNVADLLGLGCYGSDSD